MKFLAHLCLAIMILGGNFSPGTGLGAWASLRCPVHAVSLDQPKADVLSRSSGSHSGSCCTMSCCREHAEAAPAVAGCCAVTPRDAADDRPVSDVPTEDPSCPCCPGSCCLAAAGMPFCLLQEAVPSSEEQESAFSLNSDQFSTRRDEPALPPPRIRSA